MNIHLEGKVLKLMHEMTNFYDPDIKITQMCASPPVNNVQTINQNGSVFLVRPSAVPVSTQNTIPIPSQTNESYPIPTLTSNYPQLNSSRIWEQPVTPVLPHEPDPIPNDLYYSNCLVQLVGSWQIDVPNRDQLEIKLATQGDWQLAIVQRLSSVGDQWLIYDEDSRFTLCSKDDHVEAVMLKGTNTMHSLTWYNNDGTLTLWQRMGNRSSAMNHQALERMSAEFPRPSVNANVVVVPSKVDSKEALLEHCTPAAHNSNFSDDNLFNILQAHCIKDPVVL